MAGKYGPGGISTSGGVSGADSYYANRLTMAARYSQSAGVDFDTAYNIAVSPADLGGGFRSMGSRLDNSYSVADMLAYQQHYEEPTISTADIRTAKEQLKAEGWIHPDMPITDYWGPDDPYYTALKTREDYLRDNPSARAQPGTESPKGLLHFLGDITPSGIWKGIVGLVKSTGADVGKTLGIDQLANLDPEFKTSHDARMAHVDAVEAKVKATGGWDGDRARGYTWQSYYDDNWQLYGDTKDEVMGALGKDHFKGIFALDQPITKDFDAGWNWTVTHPQDATWAVINTALLFAGGGPEASVGRKAATAPVQNLYRTATEDGVRAALRVIPSDVERGIVNRYANKLVTWSTGKLGWEQAGELFAKTTNILPMAKSTVLGQALTGVYTGAAKASVAARMIGAVESGQWGPGGVNPLGLEQSSLSRLIDTAPVLGQSIAFGPIGEGRALGNVMDLTGFVWQPAGFLPLRFADIRSGATNLVGRNELAPLQQLFKVGREELISRWGGPEKAARFMRYLKAQAAIDKQLAERVTPTEENGREVIKTRWSLGAKMVEGGPAAIEEGIASVGPADVARTSLRVFADPGAKDPIVFGRAHDILDDVHTRGITSVVDAEGTPLVKVNDFKSWSGRKTGGGIWSKENEEALAETAATLEERAAGGVLSAQEAAVRGSTAEGVLGVGGASSYRMRMGKRMAEALTGEEKLIFTRADKPLTSAQGLDAWHSLTRRLAGLEDFAGSMEPGKDGLLRLGGKNLPQLGDLRAAGFTDEEITAMRLRAASKSAMVPEGPLGRYSGKAGTGIKMTAEEVQRYQQSLGTRLDELTTKFVDNHPEFERRIVNGRIPFADKSVAKLIKQMALEAPRSVTIADDNVMAAMAQMGYEPAIAAKGTLTLRDVGSADVATELGHASRMQGALDWLGVSERTIDKGVLGTLQRQQLEAELGSTLSSSHNTGLVGTAVDGRGALRQLRDVAKIAEQKRSGLQVAGRKLWNAGEIFDMRSLTVKELVDHGGMDERGAKLVQAAVRRAYAFGTVADIAHPLQSIKGLGQMLNLRGIPGAEDFFRTLGRTGGVDDSLAGAQKVVDRIQNAPGIRSALHIPDHLVRLRDFAQFALSPLFTLGEVVESSGLRALKGVPAQMPWKAEKTLEAAKLADPQGFEMIMADVFGDRVGPSLASHVGDDLDLLGMRGFFGVNQRSAEMLDGYRMYQRGDDVADIRKTLEGIYHYGNRSPLELTANYVFFPLSFQKKVGTALVGWFNQAPARALYMQTALAMYNKMDENGALTEWVDRYAPLLHQFNKLNVFAYGLGATSGPLGGKNKRVTDAVHAIVTAVSGNKGEAALGAFLPIAVSAEDRKEAAQTMKRLIPAYAQVSSFWKDFTSQLHITEGGSDNWQVSNYFDDKDALDKEIEQDMFSQGLTSGRQSLSAKKVSQDYRNWVDEQDAALKERYPRGAVFAERYTADAIAKSNELVDLASKKYHTPSENAVLTFAGLVAQEEADSRAAAGSATLSPSAKRRYQLQVMASVQKGLPVPDVPGQLTQAQRLALRQAAGNLAQRYDDFDYYYDRYFADEFGPIKLERMAV